MLGNLVDLSQFVSGKAQKRLDAADVMPSFGEIVAVVIKSEMLVKTDIY